jgi:histidinol-phosphate aminotransferase
MSKGYSLAGLRFGYAIAQPSLIEGLMKVKDSYNVDALAIAIATAAIKDQKYFGGNVEKVIAERARLSAELRGLGFDVPDSQTNFVLARCKVADAATVQAKLANLNIYVRYFALPRLEDKLRISVGTAEQNDKLLSALKEILEA